MKTGTKLLLGGLAAAALTGIILYALKDKTKPAQTAVILPSKTRARV